jgi:hypothetical protein
MSVLHKLVLVVALAAGLSTALAGGAWAADPVAARYSMSWAAVAVGETVSLQESLQPLGAAVTRHINWGDGSPVQVETGGDRWQHAYAKAGKFHISVRLEDGTVSFPYGNTVTVYKSVPKTVLSARYHLSPGRVRVNEPVTMTESEVHAGHGVGAYLFRTVSWGDGTTEPFNPTVPLHPHRYRTPGTYHVTVTLKNLQWETPGTFPGGNTITVAAAAPHAAAPAAVSTVAGPSAATIGVTGFAVVAGGAASFLARRRRVRAPADPTA